MNYIKNKLLLGLLLLLSFSCGKEDEKEDSLPAWNKDHTATIQFYSRFINQSLFSDTDYSQVITRIQTVANQAALLDRADVTYTETGIVNSTVAVAAKAGRVPLFISNSFNENGVEGTGVLIKHTYTEMENVAVAPGASMLTISTRVNTSIPISLASVFIANQSQIEAGLENITKNIDSNGVVVVGTVDKSLKESLNSLISSKSYRYKTVESELQDATKVIFVLSSLKWVVREAAEIKMDNGISCIDLKIEAL